jgi:hypothetical protein
MLCCAFNKKGAASPSQPLSHALTQCPPLSPRPADQPLQPQALEHTCLLSVTVDAALLSLLVELPTNPASDCRRGVDGGVTSAEAGVDSPLSPLLDACGW